MIMDVKKETTTGVVKREPKAAESAGGEAGLEAATPTYLCKDGDQNKPSRVEHWVNIIWSAVFNS